MSLIPSCVGFAFLMVGCAAPAPVKTPPSPPPVPVAATPVEPQVVTPQLAASGQCEIAKDVQQLPAPISGSSPDVSHDNLKATVNVLADPGLRGREAGSVDNRRVARWIADRFASYGLPPAPGNNHCVPFTRDGLNDQNVVAYLHRQPIPEAPVVLVGAHYDAQGMRDTDVFPGADDNASGVAALLEIARISKNQPTGPDLVFVAFGAEERGLLGARAYVENPSVPLSRVVLMINLDMVGRPMLDGSAMRLLIPRANETLGYVLGPRDKPQTEEILQRAAEREDRPIIGIPEVVLTRLGFASDSVPFSPHVPTIFLSTGDHRDYHRPTDTPEKIDFEQMRRTVRLTLALVEEAVRPQETGL